MWLERLNIFLNHSHLTRAGKKLHNFNIFSLLYLPIMINNGRLGTHKYPVTMTQMDQLQTNI